jgi:flagellar biosynthetic protein FliP
VTSFYAHHIVLSFLETRWVRSSRRPTSANGISLILTLISCPRCSIKSAPSRRAYRAGIIDQKTALETAAVPIKEFMLRQTKEKELNLFLEISGDSDAIAQNAADNREALTSLDLTVIIPAFITSELKRAFTIGFLLFIPFLIIDMVVSSTLMSMGMVMLPPSMIALPFKIMMFVIVDGWNLLFGALVQGFR